MNESTFVAESLPLIKIHSSQGVESWNDVVAGLLENGVALVGIPDRHAEVAASAFQVAREAMDLVNKRRIPTILPSASSAHATGYHPVGGMSQRYNGFREGFVWSDSQTFEIDDRPEFSVQTKRLELQLHALASSVMRAVARHLEISSGDDNDWFEEHLGPTQNHSQWHIKRSAATPVQQLNPGNEQWLPTHTDPSLVSVVIHDLVGAQSGGSGLQYHYNGEWHTIPVSGHSIAIIIVGSVLQHVTRGFFKACRHRVLMPKQETHEPLRRRMAATYFLRPASGAVLSGPSSSPKLAALFATIPVQQCITFDQWLQKTARNYEKSQRTNQDGRM
jgi:hypothetical protein